MYTQPSGTGAKTRKKATRNNRQQPAHHAVSPRDPSALPKHLPRCEQVLEPETTVCPCCHSEFHKIGEDVNEVLDAILGILGCGASLAPNMPAAAALTAWPRRRRHRG